MGFLAALAAFHQTSAADMQKISDEIGGWFAHKTSDQTVTSSTVLVNDSELFVPMVANAEYILTSLIIYRAAATPLMRATWTVPAGATMFYTPCSLDTSVTATPNGIINRAVHDLSVVPGWGASGAAQSVAATPSGKIITAGTAGNLQFQWAQSVSNATGTVVKTGSYIHLVRVA